ncbi:uncharacterized protein LOC123918715 isoform X3 [Trifolium pratense]|nr:uncharacterized protein LOC123918715 isoform X3 [Trifolium pratense]
MELTLLLTQLLRLDVNNFLKEDPTSFDKETREGKSLWCLWALSQTQEGLLLLEELVNSFDGEGFLAIIDASKQWFNESQVIKVECNASWWRIREDTLFALSSLSEQLLETHESGFRTSNLKNMIEQIVAEDFLIDSLEYPFLYTRIFTSVAKFSSVISNEVLEHSLDAALKAITMNV